MTQLSWRFGGALPRRLSRRERRERGDLRGAGVGLLGRGRRTTAIRCLGGKARGCPPDPAELCDEAFRPQASAGHMRL